MLSQGYFFYNLASWLTHTVRGNDEIISGHEYLSTVFIYIYFNVLQKISKESLKIHSEQLCFVYIYIFIKDIEQKNVFLTFLKFLHFNFIRFITVF